MASSVYVETTIVSYLTFGAPEPRPHAAGGDPRRAQKRLAALKAVPVLDATPEAMRLAEALVGAGAVPAQAVVDATHIAIATVHGMAYLLTWNCAHIANATMRTKIESICRTIGYEPPVLCTPEELMED